MEVVRANKEHAFIQEREAIGAKWREAEWEAEEGPGEDKMQLSEGVEEE